MTFEEAERSPRCAELLAKEPGAAAHYVSAAAQGVLFAAVALAGVAMMLYAGRVSACSLLFVAGGAGLLVRSLRIVLRYRRAPLVRDLVQVSESTVKNMQQRQVRFETRGGESRTHLLDEQHAASLRLGDFAVMYTRDGALLRLEPLR